MKGAIGITCLIWLIAGQAAHVLKPLSFKSGTTYVYDVESTLLAGIPELQNQYSGFSIIYKLDLNVQSPDKVIMQLREIRTGKLNSVTPVSYEEDIDFHHTASPEYERELSKPVEVTFKDGLVDEFKAEKSEPMWSINIKRAILSNFQISMSESSEPAQSHSKGMNRPGVTEQEDVIYSVYEEGIGGECETRYNVFSILSLDDPDQSEDVFNVTKYKNYGNCKSRPSWEIDNFDSQGCPDVCRQTKAEKHLPKYPIASDKTSSAYDSGCRYGFQPDFHPVKSYSLTKYNISAALPILVIEDIYNEGKTVYNFNGDELMVVVQQNITLLKMKPLQGQVKVQNPVSYQSLAYELPVEKDQEHLEYGFYSIFGPIDSEELVEVAMKKLEDVAEDIIPDDPQSSEYLGTKIIELTNAINVMKFEDLEKVYQQLENEKSQKLPHKEEIMRKVFLDLLGVSGTNVSAVFSIELIKDKRVSASEAVELLEGLAKNLQDPKQEVIVELMELLDRPWIATNRLLINSVALAIGKLVEEACVKPSIVPEACSAGQPASRQVQDDEEDEDELKYHPRKMQQDLNKPQSSKFQQKQQPKQQQQQKQQQYRKPYSNEDEDEIDESCHEPQLKGHIESIARRLAKAESLAKKAIYIEALAHMSTPLVLPILEPYVSGEAPELESLQPEDAEFLRLIAIYALHHIIDYYPEEVLPIVKPVYFDQSEGYEIRIASFTVIMESKPDLVLLERVMAELWVEINNQVQSFVISYLEDIANSTVPCQRRLAQQVQLVLAHAPDVDAGIQYSNTYSYDFYDDENDYGMMGRVEYVASNVSNIPRTGYVSIDHILGPFQDSILEAGFNAKGLDELWDKITRPGGILSQVTSQMGSNVQTKNIHDVLETLKGKMAFNFRQPETPRASIFFSFLGRTKYLTLDEQFILSLVEDLFNWFREIDSTSGFSEHYVKVWMPASFFKVVPSTLGFPVVVNHRKPIVVSLIIENARVASGDRKEVPLNSAFAFSTVIRPSVHVSSVVMAYAVSPAEDRLYGAAVERVYEISVPLVLDVAVDLKRDTYAVSLKPKLPHRLAFHRTRPTTFQAKAVLIDVPKSKWLDSALVIETVPEAFKIDKRFEAKPLGMSIRIQAETENIWGDIPFFLSPTAYEDGVIPALIEVLKNPGLTPREGHLYLEPHVHEPASEFVVTLDYDREISLQGDEHQESSEEESEDQHLFGEGYEQAMTQIYGAHYSVDESEKTVKHLIQKTQATWAPILGQQENDPIPATISHNWKLTSVIKGAQSKHLALQLIYAHTLDHRSIWVQLHGHKSGGQSKRPWKLCGSMVAAYPPQPNPFYLEMNAAHSLKAKVHAELGWGAQCNQDNEIVIMGVMEKSEEQLSSVSKYLDTGKSQQVLPWYYHECDVDRADGETQSEACQLAISEVSQLNRVELQIVARELSPWARNVTKSIDLALKSYLYPNMEVNPNAENEENTLTIVIENIDQLQDIPLASVYMYKPTENVFFHKIYTPFYEPPSTLDSLEEIYGDMLMGGDYDATCNLMEDFVSTFDNVTYELPDNKCQYLLAKDCSVSRDFAILASQIDLKSKTKALAVSVGPHTIKLLPPKGEQFQVVIDGEEKMLSSNTPIALDFDTDNEMIIYILDTVGPTDTSILVIETDELNLQYDGKNAELRIPRKFKGDLCGLCGDFNEEDFWEFSGPRGCTYVEAEDFANSYAISGQSCPKPPRPSGQAFCPNPKDQWQQNQKSDQDDQDDEEENEEGKPQPPRNSRRQPFRPAPVDDDDEDEPEDPRYAKLQKVVQPKKQKPSVSWSGDEEEESHFAKIKKLPKTLPQQSWNEQGVDEDDDEKHFAKIQKVQVPQQNWKQAVKSRKQQEDEDDSEEEEVVKPAGPSRCIKQVTEYIEKGSATCFTIQPVHRCTEACSPSVSSKTVAVGMHCIESSQSYVKDLKARARKTVIMQLVNKRQDIVSNINVPEKCAP